MLRHLLRLFAGVALGALLLPTPSRGADERLRVLLLDYHAPIEHDVLLSHLCVRPCTRSSGCPDELVAEGADYYSDDFVVFRPRYLGSSARFVVDVYKNRRIDLLSMSGHHASGFSGDFGRGRFHTLELADDLRNLPGRDGFFAHPSMVMLQGCWTDVKSSFVGDPIEYVRHIVEDTTVRAGESNRLLAAIQQIAGDGSAYRELFPNACILGYQGTQVPGGLLEIYGQVNNTLRGLEAFVDGREPRPARFSIAQARRTAAGLDALVREVDAECKPGGWPCNLCAQDPDYYSPLRDALVAALRSDRARVHEASETRSKGAAKQIENVLESASLYANVRWACSTADPSTPPVYPEPIDRAPHMELFLDLLMLDFGRIDEAVRLRIESELAHMLGATALPPETRARLRARLTGPGGTAWREHFEQDVLSRLSTFRQRDVYHFFAEIGCVPCLADALVAKGPERVSRVRRENAASQLRPRLGRELYERALADPAARVRLLAASRLHPGLGADLVERAVNDPDERVREAATRRLAEIRSTGEPLEFVDTAVDPVLVADLDRPYLDSTDSGRVGASAEAGITRLDFESGEALIESDPGPDSDPGAEPERIARLDFESGSLPEEPGDEIARLDFEAGADAARPVAPAPPAPPPIRTVALDEPTTFGGVSCRYEARLDSNDRVRDCVLARDHAAGGIELLAGSHAFFRADGTLAGATIYRPHTFGAVEVERGWVEFGAPSAGSARIVARGDGEYPAQ